MAKRVSIGQAAANVLAAYLLQQLTPNVNVINRWPQANVPRWAPRMSLGKGAPLSDALVSVLKFGRRTKMDAWGIWQQAKVLQGNQAIVTWLYGGIEQPMQIDIWARSDLDRDDVIAQLDDALYAGYPTTLGVYGDPVRDGILLSLAPGDGWGGFYSDYWFDDPDLTDDADSAQVAEFRATYLGEARMAFGQSTTVPAMTSIGFANQPSTNDPGSAPPGTKYQIATLQPNAVPPPPGKVIYSTSSNP